jgi:fructose-1,6-bisphosphatase/inositol monophosphatase family enzyme
MEDYDQFLGVAIEASTRAGEIIASNFQNIKSIRMKSKANPVTNVDLLAEETIVSAIEKHYPDHNILCEEVRSTERGSEYTWIIDPLDGTVNFTAGLPFVATSVGLMKGDSILLGAVFEPIRRETYTAVRGRGAFLNGKRITVSSKREMQQAVLGVDLGYDEGPRQHALQTIVHIRPDVATLRIPGSAVLGICYVACGRFDVYWHPSIYPWDVAAGSIIVAEAGGKVTDLYGEAVSRQTRTIIGANSDLYTQFMDKVAPRLTAPAT